MLVCALCALPARALASGNEQSLLMDDKQLIYSSPSHVVSTMEQLKALGIDRVKASIVWTLVAPHASSKSVPHFDATNPAAYPPGAWARWDLLVIAAKDLGMSVYFQITPPAPAWAVARGKPTQGYPWSQKPSAAQFEKFVQAIGRRYSGSYVPPGASAPLPRVSYWGIWNEPNEGAWLNPQWKSVPGHGQVYTAPAMYRQLVDAAWHGFQLTGHTHDAFLVGEIASHGWIYPIPFVDALYCVNGGQRPLTGTSATLVGCPASGSRSAFARAHPGLFATGFAHHPYSFDTPPNKVMSNRSLITLANLGRLQTALNRAFGVYGRPKGGGVPMYLTEFAYKTNPPNPFVHTSLSQQATWLNQAEYITWKDRSVRALAQFLLVDDHPRAGARPGSRSYWSTFQSGLEFVSGQHKPSYDAYRLPIWLPSSGHGHVSVWGQLRPADHSATQTAELQYQRGGSGAWSNVGLVQTSSSEGFFTTSLTVPAAGNLRVAWKAPDGTVDYSRSAAVS